MSVPGPLLGRPWLRRRNARLLRDEGRPIDEAGYIRAGGIDHFVTIRGASRDNPVLVFLHGGPGATHTVFAARTLRWEDHVTVVQYDQRGAGKTRHRHGPAADGELSLERLRQLSAGMTESARQLYPEIAAFDARAVAPEYRIPLFVFQGAADNVTPAQCARAFAETVRAPVTRFAAIPRTGHLAAFTRPEEFLRLLVEHVLPVVPRTSD